MRAHQPEQFSKLAYPIKDAAQTIGVSPRTVRYLIGKGCLGYVRLGRRIVIPHAELERLLRQGYCRPHARLDADEPIRPILSPTNNDAREAATSQASTTYGGSSKHNYDTTE